MQAGESHLQLYRHILTRTTILFLLGLLACSWFIFGWLFQAICPPAPTQKSMWAILLSPPANAQVWYFSLANLRIPGVLQRIALVYLAVAVLVIQTRSRWGLQAIMAVALLLLYWVLMNLPGFSLQPGQDLGAYIDRAVFGEAHLWRFTRTWDPEGLLSTIPAIATGLIGALTGYWLRSKHNGHTKVHGLFLFGCLGIFVGMAWGGLSPSTNTSGPAPTRSTAPAAPWSRWGAFWLFDLHEVPLIVIQPLVWLGMNPLFAYVGAQVGAIALGTFYIGTVPHHTHLGPLIQDLLFGQHWDSWARPGGLIPPGPCSTGPCCTSPSGSSSPASCTASASF